MTLPTPVDSTQVRRDRSPTELVIGGAGTLLTLGALGALAGPRGIAGGLVVAVAWYLAAGVSAFALGHLLLLLESAPAVEWLVAVEAGLLAILAAPLLGTNEPARSAAAFLAAFLGLLGVVGLATAATDALWLAALALAGVTVVASYGLHRYGLVRMGLVEVA